MRPSHHRLLSLLIAVALGACVMHFPKFSKCFGLQISLGVSPFALICIWFSEGLGNYTGAVKWHSTTEASTGCVMLLFGWGLLLLPILVVLLLKIF